LIVGINGACRSCELGALLMNKVAQEGNLLIVTVLDTKITRIDRTFTISGEYFQVVTKYMNLRPQKCKSDRFFLNYQKSKCTNQPIGKNKLGGFPKEIAEYLRLPDPDRYTGMYL